MPARALGACTINSSAPPGRLRMETDISTGFTALHPWLQPKAPPGPMTAPGPLPTQKLSANKYRHLGGSRGESGPYDPDLSPHLAPRLFCPCPHHHGAPAGGVQQARCGLGP